MASKKKTTTDPAPPVDVGDRVLFHEQHGKALVAKPADVCGVGRTRFVREDKRGERQKVERELDEKERYWTATLAVLDHRSGSVRFVDGVPIADKPAAGVCTA